jgi:hypothetical protein
MAIHFHAIWFTEQERLYIVRPVMEMEYWLLDINPRYIPLMQPLMQECVNITRSVYDLRDDRFSHDFNNFIQMIVDDNGIYL